MWWRRPRSWLEQETSIWSWAMWFLLLLCSRTHAACCEYSNNREGFPRNQVISNMKLFSKVLWLFSNLPVRAAKYGDTADECGEALFLCGKSLLELARFVGGLFLILGWIALTWLMIHCFHFSGYSLGGRACFGTKIYLILMVHYSVMVVCG